MAKSSNSDRRVGAARKLNKLRKNRVYQNCSWSRFRGDHLHDSAMAEGAQLDSKVKAAYKKEKINMTTEVDTQTLR